MRIIFITITKKQKKYFSILKNKLGFDSKILTPSIFVYPRVDSTLKQHIAKIIDLKQQELYNKYGQTFKAKLYGLYYKIIAPFVANYFYKKFIEFKPYYIVVWNGKKYFQAIALEISKILQIKPIYFENGSLPNTTTMDFKGVNATNSIPRDPNFYLRLDTTNYKQFNRNLVIRNPQRLQRKDNYTLPDNFIFVPFQVNNDSQIIIHSPWIKNMIELFAIIKKLSEQLDISFVLKEHPSDRKSNFNQLYALTNKNIFFSNIDTQTLIKKSSAIITINSTVGIESLIFHKKIIVLGEAFFAIKDIVIIAKNYNQLKEKLQKLDSFKLNINLIENFILYLYNEYLIDGNWRSPDDKHLISIKNRLKKHYMQDINNEKY